MRFRPVFRWFVSLCCGMGLSLMFGSGSWWGVLLWTCVVYVLLVLCFGGDEEGDDAE